MHMYIQTSIINCYIMFFFPDAFQQLLQPLLLAGRAWPSEVHQRAIRRRLSSENHWSYARPGFPLLCFLVFFLLGFSLVPLLCFFYCFQRLFLLKFLITGRRMRSSSASASDSYHTSSGQQSHISTRTFK